MNESNTWERTFVLLKPDASKRALLGTILSRFEQAGLTLTAMRMENVDREKAEQHYMSHRGKSFFEPLVSLLCSGPVVAMAFEGAHAISVVRKLVGATEPKESAPGSIRGDYCHMSYPRSKERLGVIPNLVHASDSPESAEWELNLWFSDGKFSDPGYRCDAPLM